MRGSCVSLVVSYALIPRGGAPTASPKFWDLVYTCAHTVRNSQILREVKNILQGQSRMLTRGLFAVAIYILLVYVVHIIARICSIQQQHRTQDSDMTQQSENCGTQENFTGVSYPLYIYIYICYRKKEIFAY